MLWPLSISSIDNIFLILISTTSIIATKNTEGTINIIATKNTEGTISIIATMNTNGTDPAC